ncbi:MAG: hypothetical protein GY847_18040 [Proteobacteria bacterium]|nr:hypothetical protein [Pseudomonadota bacterium]
MVDWTPKPLGEVMALQRGHDLPERLRETGDIPVIGSAGPNGFHNVVRARGPGVTVGRSGVGSMGKAHFCKTDYWPHNTVLYVKDFKGNVPRYLYYLLHSLDLRRLNTGSAQASLDRKVVHKLVIQIPDVDEQRAIASVLGALDDKIELNRQMNRTLEEMAAALFKSWFVDFDPVHAKAAGSRPFGMDDETAALFPDRFVETEGGEIPEGWRVTPLETVCNMKYGKFIAKKQLLGGPYPVYSGYQVVGYHDEHLYDDSQIVMVCRGVGGSGDVKMSPPKCWVTNLSIVIAPKDSETLKKQFLYRCLLSTDRSGLITGSAQHQVTINDLGQHLVLVPPARCQEAYCHSALPMDRAQEGNGDESRTLADLRDTLLPKLLSGEIRLKQAEKAVEGAI